MSEGRRHVLVLNQYAPPDAASTGRYAAEIAATIAAAGHTVTFVAGQPSYLPDQGMAPAREHVDGVDYRRLRIAARGGRRTRVSRFAGYLTYLAGAALASLRLVLSGGVDTIVCFHNPPFLALIGVALARRGRRLICIVQDIHPDVLVATGWISLPRPIHGAWDALNRWTLRKAAVVVVISSDMRDVLLDKGLEPDRVVSIPLWAEPELTPGAADPAVRARLGIADEELMVLFTGNMGVTQRLEPVFAAAEQLRGEPVRFCFVGGGVNAARWQQDAAHLPNVTFLPFQADADYRRLVAACDVGLVTLTPLLERLVVPSRSFPLLSAGVPLLAVMGADCELGRLVREHRCGVCALEPAELAGAVRAWLADPAGLEGAGRRARQAYETTRDRAALTRRYVELVEAR